MKIDNHRLTEAIHFESPNQDKRPADEISLIVLHGISLPPGEFGSDLVRALFTNRLDADRAGLPDLVGVKVSSHLYISRQGEVEQFVSFDQRAWHAGTSSRRGRDSCNDFAIGIELEGTDDLAYEDAQYETLTRVCACLMSHYGIMDVAGHCHIAPGRKTDPGQSFDWHRLKRKLAGIL